MSVSYIRNKSDQLAKPVFLYLLAFWSYLLSVSESHESAL